MTITRTEFEDQVRTMKPGEKIRYHVGSLVHDREHSPDFGKVGMVAHAALMACEEGKVHLVQRRVRHGEYEYFAVKRPSPHKPVNWTGCYDPDRTTLRKVVPASPRVVQHVGCQI